jgi:hypothetical protein
MLFSAILSLALALGVSAQGSQVPYTEPKSGITVTAYINSNYVFGVALPTTPSADFIGVMVGKGTGWAAVSLGGPMTQNALLLATWPNSKAILSSFRKTTSVPVSFYIPHANKLQLLRLPTSSKRSLDTLPHSQWYLHQYHALGIHFPLQGMSCH